MAPVEATPPRPLPLLGALQRCFRDRVCTRCGACCDFFDGHEVPYREDVGTVDAPGSRKEVKRGVCPHLVDGELYGEKLCALHEQKETDPRLLLCRSWRADPEKADVLALHIALRIVNPKTRGDVSRIVEKYLRPGIFVGSEEVLRGKMRGKSRLRRTHFSESTWFHSIFFRRNSSTSLV